MVKDKEHLSEQVAYDALLAVCWKEAPGIIGERFALNETAAKDFLCDRKKTSNAAVAIGFMSYSELLLAGNLLGRGDVDAAWRWMDVSQTHALATYQINAFQIWLPSAYKRQIFEFDYFCTYFSLALARGSEKEIKWYAQQLYNLRRGGLADRCSRGIEYLELYWEMAIAVIRNEWPAETLLSSDLGIYRELFLSVGDDERTQRALLACAKYHLDLAAYTAPKNDDEAVHPFRTMHIGHIAYELMGWAALHKRLSGPLKLTISHPMLLPPLFSPPQQKQVSDDLIEKLHANARAEHGDDWQMEVVPNYDEMWPEPS